MNLDKEQSLSSGSIPWENGNPLDESEIRVEVIAIPPVKTKAIASMGTRLREWERVALSVGNPRRDAERLSNRMKELKKISLGLGSGEDVSTPEDSPSEDECKGSDIPMKEICSKQEAHERYWATPSRGNWMSDLNMKSAQNSQSEESLGQWRTDPYLINQR